MVFYVRSVCKRKTVAPACRYIFPGLALGAFLGQTKIITDHMVMAAAEALPKMLTSVEKQRRQVYPDLANIREISAHVAMEVRAFLCPLCVACPCARKARCAVSCSVLRNSL